MKVTITLADRLAVKLKKLGLGERKAREVAKGLVATVRAVVKTEIKKLEGTPIEEPPYLPPNTPFTKTKAQKVNGYSVRFDLPVAPMPGLKGIEMLRVMDGLTSTATYLVAAVKGEEGILAVRQLGVEEYNVKFYPTFAYWGKTEDDLRALGAHDVCQRTHYERMHFGPDALDGLLNLLADEAKPKSRMKKLVDRFLTISLRPLLKGFSFLHQRIGVTV
jgi:hypothetical protein